MICKCSVQYVQWCCHLAMVGNINIDVNIWIFNIGVDLRISTIAQREPISAISLHADKSYIMPLKSSMSNSGLRKTDNAYFEIFSTTHSRFLTIFRVVWRTFLCMSLWSVSMSLVPCSSSPILLKVSWPSNIFVSIFRSAAPFLPFSVSLFSLIRWHPEYFTIYLLLIYPHLSLCPSRL